MVYRRGDNFRQSRVLNQMRRADERRNIIQGIKAETKAKEAAEKDGETIQLYYSATLGKRVSIPE